MKRLYVLAAVGVVLVLVVLAIFMPSGILLSPATTPAAFLATRPYISIGDVTIIVPSSTVIVYLLGIQIVVLGYLLYHANKPLWGVSLFFWGLGTLLAGTSYQGLGYELKCDGNPLCQFTSWFELSYLFVTAISISLMGVAFAKDVLAKDQQKALMYYSYGAIGGYTILLVLGSIRNNAFLISYELFSIFYMPLFVVFFVINVRQYSRTKSTLNKSFITLWLLFLLVNILYYAYYLPSFTQTLYDNTGIWFSANDVLHIGLIGWFLYFQFYVQPKLIASKNQVTQ